MSDEFVLSMAALRGERLKKWPRGEDGEPVTPAFLCRCSARNMEDEMIINMLEAYGIPAFRVYPGDGGFGKVVMGMPGTGSDILVPETMLEDAKTLMEAESDDQLQS